MSVEDADALKLEGENIIRASFSDGAFHNFPASQKIADNIWMLPATGHTKGNSIVIAKDGDLFYLIHGDVTYCDAALKVNKLSIIFEDKQAARETRREYRRNATPKGGHNDKAQAIAKARRKCEAPHNKKPKLLLWRIQQWITEEQWSPTL